MAAENALTPEKLIGFIDSIHEHSFAATPDQRIWARNILIALAAQDRLPRNGAELAGWLTPVFCGTPGEQTEFRRLCKEWSPGSEEQGQRDQNLREPGKRPRRRWVWLAAVLVLVSLLAGWAEWARRMRVDPLPHIVAV